MVSVPNTCRLLLPAVSCIADIRQFDNIFAYICVCIIIYNLLSDTYICTVLYRDMPTLVYIYIYSVAFIYSNSIAMSIVGNFVIKMLVRTAQNGGALIIFAVLILE